MFGLIWKAIAGGNLMSWVALGIGVMAALGGTYAAGYYYGNEKVVTKVIDASLAQVAAAKDAGTKAQATQDAKDQAANKVDYDSRHKKDEDRNAALAALIKTLQTTVPHNKDCKVSSQAMHGLNDPSLIGETTP